MPPCDTNLPFICELCTTRVYLQREIDPFDSSDMQLLMLERIRMIDMAHAWPPKNLPQSCSTLRRINRFFTPIS